MTFKHKVELTVTASVLAVGGFLYLLSLPPPSSAFPPECEIQPFDLLRQPDSITCGPTSATMVLRYYGIKVELDAVKRSTKTEWLTIRGKSVGTTAPDLILQAFKRFQLPAHMYTGTAPQFLLKWVSEGRPCVVLLRSGPLRWHYVVVVGYTRKTVIIANPGGGIREEMPTKTFLDAWSFEADMNGDKVKPKCPICDGIGHIGRWNLGPLNSCDVCSGTGSIPDMAKVALRWLEISPFTAIIPDQHK